MYKRRKTNNVLLLLIFIEFNGCRYSEYSKVKILFVNKYIQQQQQKLQGLFQGYFSSIKIFPKDQRFSHARESNPRSSVSKASADPFCQTVLKRENYFLILFLWAHCLSTIDSKEG